MRRRQPRGGAAAAALLCCLIAAGPAAAAGGEVRFNEAEIEALRAEPSFDVEDVAATFEHVFAALPDEVTVYPTENYHYFTFLHDGVEYAGNMRLDVADRDDGVLHFAYFAKSRPWLGELLTRYRPLTAADGVVVKKLEQLVYEVSHGGRGVVFRLNDLSGVRPPDEAVRPGETYLGPVFDESGLQFFLLFDEGRKDFLFVLNEEEVPDRLVRVHEDHPALTVGARTGFAFYEDRFAERKILAGVNAGEVALNTANDGPFDQLPDNFLEGEALRDAILTMHPDLEGSIDRLGVFATGEGRFLVNPYVNYEDPRELEGFLRCGDDALGEDAFYRCVFPSRHR